MKKRGRKPLVPGTTQSRHTVTIDEMTARQLMVLGDKNLSRGIRVAAAVAWAKYQKDDPLPEVR
jgi:hypothetical protein